MGKGQLKKQTALSYSENLAGAGRMLKQIKVLVSQPNSLRSIPEHVKVETESQPH